MNDQDQGFVLSNTPYREYDAMILFLAKEYGLLRFVLRGYYRPSAKQTSLGLEYTKVNLRFKYHENRLLRIQSGELMNAYSNVRNDYDWLLQMSLLTELLEKFYMKKDHEFWYQTVNDLYKEINLEKLIILMVNLIRILGIVPHVEGCVISASPKVSDFSIEKGGFVSKAYRKHKSQVDLEMMKYIRALFIHEKIDESALKDYENTDKLANLLIEYIEYYEGIRLNSWKLMY